MASLKIILVILAVIVQGFYCFELGNVTADSKLIYRGYFNHSAIQFETTWRREEINTDEDISAIRAVDISGQNGTASMNTYSMRRVEMIFQAGSVGRGFNFSLELYNNKKSGGVAYKSVSMMWIAALAAIVGAIGFTKSL